MTKAKTEIVKQCRSVGKISITKAKDNSMKLKLWNSRQLFSIINENSLMWVFCKIACDSLKL